MNEEKTQKPKNLKTRLSDKWMNISTQSRFFILSSILSALIIFFYLFVKISFLLDTPWLTVMVHVYFTPLLIYFIGIMFKPSLVFLIVFLGLTFGEIFKCAIFGCSGEFPLFLTSNLISQGGGALIVSMLRKKNELLAMFLGAIWMFLWLFITSFIYYSLILFWSSDYVIIYSLLFFVIYLAFIPFTLLLAKIIRLLFKVRYLESIIGLQENISH